VAPEPKWRASGADIEAIVSGRHGDPFGVMGLHRHGNVWAARVFIPSAKTVTLSGSAIELDCRHRAGFFEGAVSISGRHPLTYEASNNGVRWTVTDPYSFGPVLGPLDDYYLAEGTHLRLHDKLGAHVLRHEGYDGVHFAVWAPNAARVSVVGDFNGWDGRCHAMRKRRDTGVWEIFIPGALKGQAYKYEIVASDGKLLPLKSDPFGFHAEFRPKTASLIAEIGNFTWTDQLYLDARAARDHRRAPVSIYEVHLGSWKRNDDNGLPRRSPCAAATGS